MRRIPLIIGIVAIVFGLTMFGAPALFRFFDPLPEPISDDAGAMQVWTGVSFQRIAGALIAGVGVLCVALSQLRDPRSAHIVASALALVGVASVAITVIQQISIWSTPAGWLIAAVLALVTAAAIVSAVTAQHDRDRERAAQEGQRAALDAQLRDTAAQEERNRLARDLHDTIKQQLFSINVAAATAQSLRERDPEAAAQHIQQVRTLSQAASVEMKALLTQLRPQPLVTTGLIGAIEEQLDALRFRSDVQTEFTHDGLPDETQLPLGAQEALFRVVQEALANVARHARARRVTVSVKREAQSETKEALMIAVRDDGQGFDATDGRIGMGMSNMRARVAELGGTFDAQSSLGGGTTITLGVPLQQPRDARQAQRHEKEERGQRVYLASTLSGFAVIFAAALTITLFSLGIGAQNATANWTAFTLALALGTALVLPLFIAAMSFRRRVSSMDDPTGIWRMLLRNYDQAQLAFLSLFAAWTALSFRSILLAIALTAVAAVIFINVYRLQRALNDRITEWATVRGLQSRLNEQAVFLPFGVAFVVLVFAGVFGDVRQARLFHDTFNETWLLSFLIFAYPLILLCALPTVVLLRHQIRTLKAIEGDEADEPPAPATSRDLRGQRIGATAYTVGFIIAALAVGPSLMDGTWVVVAGMVGVMVLMLGLKFRVERQLTARVREWTTLTAQTSAQAGYGLFFAVALIAVASGLIGGIIGASSPDSDVPSPSTAPIGVLVALATLMFASPLWLGPMTLITRERIHRLKAPSGATVALPRTATAAAPPEHAPNKPLTPNP